MTHLWSPACKALVKRFEAFSADPYPDAAGNQTVGWGHLIQHGDDFILPLSDEDGDAILSADLDHAAQIVDGAVTVHLTQNELDALTSFVFNVGPGTRGIKAGFVTLKNGQPSTMLRFLNDGDFASAAEEFPRWVNAGNIVLEGLLNRRLAEQALFLAPVT